MIDSINNVAAREIPFLDQYFGVWACYEPIFRAGFERISKMNLAVHLQEVRAARMASGDARKSGYGYNVAPGGIAIVDISGTLMKQESSATNSTSTVMMRRTMRALANDDDVAGVLIRFDSPGGTVAGTQDLADEIAALAAKKPTSAYVEDLCASAAYWLASMCDEISANKGLIGSIGTYSVVTDESAAAAKEGVKVHVVRAGQFKGMGVPGTEVTQEQLGEVQRIVDALNDDFVNGVAKGREMPAAKVKEIADGRVHPSSEAMKIGLIDYVESFDQAMSRLKARTMGAGSPVAATPGGPVQRPGMKPKGQSDGATEPRSDEGEQTEPTQSASGPTAEDAGARALDPQVETVAAEERDIMSQTQTPAAGSQAAQDSQVPKPATMAELKAACPGATSDFLVEQMEKNATVAQAKDAFIQFQSTQIRARDEELEKTKATQTTTATATVAAPVLKKPGVPAVAEAAGNNDRQTGSGSAIQQLGEIRDKHMKLGMDRISATARAIRENPELQQAAISEQTEKTVKVRNLQQQAQDLARSTG